MKKIIYILFTVLLITSCTDDNLSNLNIDPKRPSTVPGSTLFTNAEKNLFDQVNTYSTGSNMMRLWAQHWTETTYNDEANYDIIGRDPSRNFWITLYGNVLNDLKSAKILTDEDITLSAAVKTNRNALITILEVYTYQMLVDLNGNIPYSEALDIVNTSPKYDDAATIYADLIIKINEAISTINLGAESFGSADFIYGGNINNWKKFANSIKLRLGMRLADVDASTAKTVVSQAVASGVFTSNADNATIQYENAPPNNNPVHNYFVLANRGSDIIAGKTIIDIMLSLNDPRISDYFDQNLGAGVYIGGPIGGNNAYANYTHVNPNVSEVATAEGLLLDYAQVEFLLAEAAERSFVGSPANAAAHYNAGISASFNYWGRTDVATYLLNPLVNYATAAGDWKVKIGTQKWLALYNQGFEAWTEYRRLDAPTLVLSDQTNLQVPKRVFYPTTEAALNGVNYNDAVTAIGGNDNLTTPLFWDKF